MGETIPDPLPGPLPEPLADPVSIGPSATLLVSEGWGDYALVDSGGGRKLERCGPYLIDRPEPQAMWQPRRPEALWESADAVFTGTSDEAAGRWRFRATSIDRWETGYDGLRFFGRFTAFRHLGFFPEQTPHWNWMSDRLRALAEADAARDKAEDGPGEAEDARPRLLNLFGYTGVASLLAARAGAAVVHVDASKKAIAWSRENRDLSGLQSAPIRWICDDARKFVDREERRGRRYHGLLIDPPKYGRGPKGEVWSLFEDLPGLLRQCRRLLMPGPAFVILTTYAMRASFLAFHELMAECFPDGGLDSGELVMREQGGGRQLATSLFTRWSRGG